MGAMDSLRDVLGRAKIPQELPAADYGVFGLRKSSL